MNLNTLLGMIPQDWFLKSLGETTEGVHYKGDQHTHIGWRAELQHRSGGRLTPGESSNPALALANAIDAVNEGYRQGRWHGVAEGSAPPPPTSAPPTPGEAVEYEIDPARRKIVLSTPCGSTVTLAMPMFAHMMDKHARLANRRAVPKTPEGYDLFAVNTRTGTFCYVNHAGEWHGMPDPTARARMAGPSHTEHAARPHGKVPLRRMKVTQELAATVYGDVIDWQGKTFAPNGHRAIPARRLGLLPDAFMYVRDDDMSAYPILTFNRWPEHRNRDGSRGRFREVPLWEIEEGR